MQLLERARQEACHGRSLERVEDVETLHKRLQPPPPAVIRYLRAQGASVDALAEPELPAMADVLFLDDLPFFDFASDGEEGALKAIIFIARDELGEPCDLVAWSGKNDRLAAWYGSASLLGLENCWAPRLAGSVLSVFENPLDWLRAGRSGVVVIDPSRAARILRDCDPLVASSETFGLRLRGWLTQCSPRIFVPAPVGGAA